MSKMKVGLVLSGGGAKGAYQVGVLKALAELGTEIHAVSGASIGSLNGAILASASSLNEGAARLEEIWLELANNSPLEFNKSVYPLLLLSTGMQINPQLRLLNFVWPAIARRFFPNLENLDAAILSNRPLSNLLDKYLCLDKLSEGLPFYVSVFKSRGLLMDFTGILKAEFGISNNPDSEYFHLQSLPHSQQQQMLMASAAIPLIFSDQRIDDEIYTDGGQGAWSQQHGNTPLKPLIDAGCNMVIVTHLNDGSLWSRHDFPNTTILEIRPQTSLGREKGMLGAVKDILGFNSEKITSWIEQGYVDTMICMESVLTLSKSWHEMQIAEQQLLSREPESHAVDQRLESSMSKLLAFKNK
ncbi:patatin-like phospholipase family protein [Shewanella xiamenensis]|uniref:patatin-like phospholipase family protein n=1 Tax=Shewanella xiamenensis TaxID=332186 RepID=UPI00313EBD7E